MSSTSVKPIPDTYPVCAPYLAVKDAAKALDFYQRAFGAKERMRMAAPDGKVMHAEIEINGGLIMLADEFPECGHHGPEHYGGSPVVLNVYVPDVDAFVKKAGEAGCNVVTPPQNQFYGDRSAKVVDPYGHTWGFATHVEDVPPDEMQRRFAAMCSGGGFKE